MNVQEIASMFIGAELSEMTVLADCYVNGAREICLQMKLRIKEDTDCHKRILIADFIREWMKPKLKAQKQSTYDRLESTVNHQIMPAFGTLYLDELQSTYIQSVIDELADMYSYSTLTKTYQYLNAMLESARLHHLIYENPMSLVVLPRNEGKTLRDIVVYSPEECDRIIAECYAASEDGTLREPNAPLLPFLLHTGLRIGEALALRWSDVDTESHFVRIRKNIKSVKNRSGNAAEPHYIMIEQKMPKTKSGIRIVPLNPEAQKALAALPHLHNNDLLFSQGTGAHLTYATVRRMLERVLTRAGVQVRGFHAFRHTFATNLFANNVDVKTVSKILGHSGVKITYDIYIHSIQEQEARAVALLGKTE